MLELYISYKKNSNMQLKILFKQIRKKKPQQRNICQNCQKEIIKLKRTRKTVA